MVSAKQKKDSYNNIFYKSTLILFFFNDFCSHICYPQNEGGKQLFFFVG